MSAVPTGPRSVASISSYGIHYARCEPCQFGQHPGGMHTWAGREDIEHAAKTGQPDPSASRCACPCTDGPEAAQIEAELDNGDWPVSLDAGPCPECGATEACAYDSEGQAPDPRHHPRRGRRLMARSYGQIMSAIWNDPDFRRLSALAQRAYLMLVTQSDISSAGMLALTVRRWSQYASDTPSDALSDALSELAGTRFVVIDFDTEELLVRRFVKWDGGAGNEKRRPAITAAANAVVSQRIRGVLAVELSKLNVPHSLCDAPSDKASDTPRVVVTEVSTIHNPEPEPETTTLNPESGNQEEPSSADADPPSESIEVAEVRDDVERLCCLLADLIAGNGSKRPTVTAKWRDAARLMLDADQRTEAQIGTAIRWCQADDFWRSNILSMPKLREKYDQLRLAAQRPARASQSDTDVKVAATYAMAARYEAQDNYSPRELTDGHAS